jgi:hypothetical protein
LVKRSAQLPANSEYEKGTNRIGAGRPLRIAEVRIAIMEAMSKIKNPSLRRTVIEIAEKLAET